jgi:hypothetical protein
VGETDSGSRLPKAAGDDNAAAEKKRPSQSRDRSEQVESAVRQAVNHGTAGTNAHARLMPRLTRKCSVRNIGSVAHVEVGCARRKGTMLSLFRHDTVTLHPPSFPIGGACRKSMTLSVQRESPPHPKPVCNVLTPSRVSLAGVLGVLTLSRSHIPFSSPLLTRRWSWRRSQSGPCSSRRWCTAARSWTARSRSARPAPHQTLRSPSLV